MSDMLGKAEGRLPERLPISTYIWKPWYAKVYWTLTPSIWFVGADWVRDLPEWLRFFVVVVSLFTTPPVAFLVLAFPWLEKLIHDPSRKWEEQHLVRPAQYPFERGPLGLCPSADPLDPRAGIHWQFDSNNPISPFHK